jgi:TRAP transporter TAXI family solute receptor
MIALRLLVPLWWLLGCGVAVTAAAGEAVPRPLSVVATPAEQALATVLTRQASAQLEPALAVQPVGGALAAVEAVAQHPGYAVVRADIARAAYLGTGPFASPHKDLRAVAMLHPHWLAVLGGPQVASFAALGGKRIAVRNHNSGDREALWLALDLVGVARASVQLVASTDPTADLAAGRADAAVAVAAAGDATVTAALQAGAKWLAMSEDVRPQEDAWPWQSGHIQATDFAGLAGKIRALWVPQMLVASALLPPAEVEDVVESLFGGLATIHAAHPGLVPIRRETAAMPAAIALHDGASAAYERGGPLDRPIEVRTTLWLLDLSEFDIQKGTFAFDATFEMHWLDPRLSPAEAQPFEIMNAVDVRIQSNGYEPKGAWHTLNWRISGRARAHFDLHAYPFDHQVLSLAFEHPRMEAAKMVYHCETRWHPEGKLDLRRHRLGPDFSLRDWELQEVRSRESQVSYGPGEFYSRYAFEVEIRRELLRFFVAELLPILLMVLLSLSASFIPADKLDGKLLLTVLSLLVAVEQQAAVREHMPDLGYMTLVDWAFLLAYVAIAIGVVQTIVEYRLHAHGRHQASATAKLAGTVLAAALFFVPVAVLLIVHAWGS